MMEEVGCGGGEEVRRSEGKGGTWVGCGGGGKVLYLRISHGPGWKYRKLRRNFHKKYTNLQKCSIQGIACHH
jgi:hypothetical protein